MGMAIGQQMGQALQPQPAGQAQAPAAAAAAPRPPPQPSPWYIGVNGQQQGPFDSAGLTSAATAGSLTAATLIWRAGMAAWTPAGQVPEVAALLGAVPPPLPPA
jgi:hypothetical protein